MEVPLSYIFSTVIRKIDIPLIEQSHLLSHIKIDDPNVIQRIRHFDRTLSDLHNVFCDVCKEHFPTINSND